MLHQVVVNASADKLAAAALRRLLWIQRTFENIPIGTALTYAYYTGDDWLTAKELAELVNISEDTARRALSPLCDLGRVHCHKDMRTTRYRLAPEIARKAIEQIITVPA